MAARNLREWALLPSDVVDLILENLSEKDSDYVRFGAVCKNWFPVAADHKKKRWNNCHLCWFLKSNLALPSDRNLKWCGSSHGWLAYPVKSSNKLKVRLLNPISGHTIDLPSIMDIPEGYDGPDFIPEHWEFLIRKVILSCDPSEFPNDFVAVAIYSEENYLASIKSGDESWSYINKDFNMFSDVIFSRGKLYGVDYDSGVLSVDIFGTLECELLFQDEGYFDDVQKVYIIEASKGDLLVLRRTIEELDTVDFQLYKFIEDDCENWLVAIESLGDDAVFYTLTVIQFLLWILQNTVQIAYSSRMTVLSLYALSPLALVTLEVYTSKMEF